MPWLKEEFRILTDESFLREEVVGSSPELFPASGEFASTCSSSESATTRSRLGIVASLNKGVMRHTETCDGVKPRQTRHHTHQTVDCSHYQLFHLARNIITSITLERRLHAQIPCIAILRGLALENEDPA